MMALFLGGLNIVPEAAFADGTVLAALQGFDPQVMDDEISGFLEENSITLSGWYRVKMALYSTGNKDLSRQITSACSACGDF